MLDVYLNLHDPLHELPSRKRDTTTDQFPPKPDFRGCIVNETHLVMGTTLRYPILKPTKNPLQPLAA